MTDSVDENDDANLPPLPGWMIAVIVVLAAMFLTFVIGMIVWAVLSHRGTTVLQDSPAPAIAIGSSAHYNLH
ncbi:MAG TPA: hypothetical protein VFE47_03515 [Tepidisphaeraceae bacterium]|jgi:hypothetical protein|nr:hypothetical protein [Tepidisphaeraceae bacterium]